MVAGGLVVALAACGPRGGGGRVPDQPGAAAAIAPATDESQRRMETVLAGIRERDFAANPFFGEGEIRELERRLAEFEAAGATREHAETLGRLGFAMVNHGRIEEGIARLEECLRLYERHGAPEAARAGISFRLGVAWLRLGETENCCARNSPESCIMPLQGAAIHADRRGSESAVRHLREVIASEGAAPALKLRAIWLVNLAHMTLGTFPDGVPADIRLPATFLDSESPFPRFANVGASAGVASDNLAGGVAIEDFDLDGDFDIVTSSWDSAEPLRYFENRRSDGFRERTREAGFERILGGLNLIQADYDNDGDIDLFVLRGAWLGRLGRQPNSLLQNQGDGTFRDATFDAGLGESQLPSSSAGWADYDNDGDLDLFVGNESSRDNPAPCRLFRNNGDGTFADVTEEAGVANNEFTKGVSWGDVDNDGRPDLFVSNLSAANRLYLNQGDGTFVDVARETGVEAPRRSFPTWFWDYDNDGNLDLFVSSYTRTMEAVMWEAMGNRDLLPEASRLYRGDGTGRFVNVAPETGLDSPMLAMGSNFGDLDNDGFLDFYLGTGEPDIAVILPNRLYRNDGGTRFVDVTMASGLGHLQKGHGVAFADLNADGAQDVFEQMGGANRVDHYRDALYRNPGFGNHWIMVRLEGTRSNRSAIGVRIRAEVEEDGVRRSIHRVVGAGGSFGAGPLVQHIGLGKAARIETLEIHWPTSKIRQVFREVEADQSIALTEGSDEVRRIAVEAFALGAAD